MAKQTLYDVLLVSKLAGQDDILAAYQRLLQKFQADSSQDSQNQAKFIQHAYEVLSDTNKKAIYDQRLANEENPPQLATYQSDQYKSDFADASDGWWKSPKVTWIIIASVALIGFSLFTGHTGEKNKVEIVKESEITKRQANELNATNISKHFDNEGALVNGVVENQSKYIDVSANVANREIDVANREADRRRTELEYRANAGNQQLEMQRKRQEADIELQRKQQALDEDRINIKRAEKENRYNFCFADALDKYAAYSDASGKATQACKDYR